MTVDACLLPRLFTYLTAWQHLTWNLPITDSSGRKYAESGLPLPQLLQGAFRKSDAGVPFLSAFLYLTVCYDHFFTFPYSTATYAKRATYRLKAVDASLSPIVFTYFTVWQYYTRIFRLQTQTHQGENVETSRCSKLSAEKCKWLAACKWRGYGAWQMRWGKLYGRGAGDKRARTGDKTDTAIQSHSEKAKTSGGKVQKESGILLRTLYKLSYKFLINSKNSQYICWKLQ